MKLTGSKIPVDFTPLMVSGNIVVEGGPTVQYFDGLTYVPNRSGVLASPLIVKHVLDIKDPDEIAQAFAKSTKYYANEVAITSETAGFELLGDDSVKVTLNVPAGDTLVLKAVTTFLDPRTDASYSREDITYLRTILKVEEEHQLVLEPRGRLVLDAYRNPNKLLPVTLTLLKGSTFVTDFTGLTFKWLNSDKVDVLANELYAKELQDSNRKLIVDLSYIESEVIRCEVWEGLKLLASDEISIKRQYNSFMSDMIVPDIPVTSETRELNCYLYLVDRLGSIDVDAAFDTTWIVATGSTAKEVGKTSVTKFPITEVNLKGTTPEIYPNIKRREAFKGIMTVGNKYITDGSGKIISALKLGK